jgi:hypothetical protein
MPVFRRKSIVIEAVQWTGDDQAWSAICALHADSELVAFREDDGTVSIETAGGRVAAQPSLQLRSALIDLAARHHGRADRV